MRICLGRAIVWIFMVVAACVLAITPASAGNFGSTASGGNPANAVSIGNDYIHPVFLQTSLSSGMAAATRWSITNNFDIQDEQRSLACHELGHTVGLRHPTGGESPGSCLGASPPDICCWGLTGHDVAHINGLY